MRYILRINMVNYDMVFREFSTIEKATEKMYEYMDMKQVDYCEISIIRGV